MGIALVLVCLYLLAYFLFCCFFLVWILRLHFNVLMRSLLFDVDGGQGCVGMNEGLTVLLLFYLCLYLLFYVDISATFFIVLFFLVWTLRLHLNV